jgi:hypothetical protein
MKATIRIDMNNAAFDPEEGETVELARILRNLAGRLDEEMADYFDVYPLYDTNGNQVGSLQIKK